MTSHMQNALVQAVDSRPVLDLSTVPDDVSLVFASAGNDVDMTLIVQDASEPGAASLSVSLDLGMPESSFEQDVAYDLEVEAGQPA